MPAGRGAPGSTPDDPSDPRTAERIRRLRVLIALLGLYLIWGSTYLAIRVAIETLPPFLMAGSRLLVAGTILYLWSRSRGAPHPGVRYWRTALVAGVLMLSVGNGVVVWAEHFVPSGLVALLVATVPIWMVLLDWASGRGPRPALGTAFGVVWGFAGAVILLTGAEIGRGTPQDLLGGLLVLGGTISWATGSLVARYGARPPSPGIGTAMQLLGGGGILFLFGLFRGEAGSFDPAAVSSASVLAFLYLLVFGSLVAFTTYVWLLRNTTPAVASTYAYVNPVVALFLGWALADEPLGPRTFLAAFVILSAVVIITTRRTSKSGV